MKRGFVILLFLIVVLIVPSVFAIGLSPTKYDVAFEPFLNRTFDLTVINTGAYPVNATVKFGSSLAHYVEYTPQVYPLGPNSLATLSFRLVLPATLEPPGKHTLDIIAEEVVPSVPGQFAITTSSVIKLTVDVPYPGKYLDLGASLSSVNEGEPVLLQLTFTNKGRERITAASGLADLVAPDGRVLATKKTPSFFLAPGESVTHALDFTSSSLSAGTYLLRYFADYDAKQTPFQESPLRVGTLFVNLTAYTRTFLPDTINRFELVVQSLWNTRISTLHGDIVILRDDHPLTTPMVTLNSFLEPWSEATLTAFFDTTSLDPGRYDAAITLHYENTTSTVVVPIDITPPSFALSPFILFTLFFFFFVLLVATILLLVRRKRDRKRLHEYKGDLYKDLLGESSEDSSWPRDSAKEAL